jgi:hypothetical protein
VPREALLDEAAGAPPGSSDAQVSGGYSTAALATNGAGQTDVSSYTGSMSTVTANRVPMDTIARADAQKSRPLTGAAAELDKVLLKPLAIAPGGLDGGQVVTQKLKFRGKAERAIDVTVEFAGDAHHFHLIAPRK